MSNNMADETKAVVEETTKEPEKKEESSTPEGDKAEPQIPLSRFRKVNEELKELKVQTQGSDLTEQVKKTISLLETEREKAAAEEKAQLKADLEDLHKVHGEFDNKKLLKTVEDYGVYEKDGTVKWDKAVELMRRLEKAPSAEKIKLKMPSSSKTGDQPQKAPYDLTGKSIYDIAEEAKKEL